MTPVPAIAESCNRRKIPEFRYHRLARREEIEAFCKRL